MTAIRTWDPPICRFRVRPAPWQLDTVTRAADESAFDIVYRVIPSGRKTPFMEQLAAGDTVRFGGRFGVPVDEGIGKTGSTSSEELFLFNSAVKLEAAAEGVVEVNCVVK